MVCSTGVALTGDAIRSGSAYQTIAAAISTQAMTLTSSAMFGSRLHDEIADFSVGDWQAEAGLICENTVDTADRALGPIEWWVSPPPVYLAERRITDDRLALIW